MGRSSVWAGLDGRMKGMGATPEDETITESIRRVSALAGREAEVSILAGGYTNGVFLVQAGDERYVFRVPGQSSDVLEINRADERYNAEMAARTGVAPDVVDYVEGLDVMVLTFVDGHVPTSEDLQTSSTTAITCGSSTESSAGTTTRASTWA